VNVNVNVKCKFSFSWLLLLLLLGFVLHTAMLLFLSAGPCAEPGCTMPYLCNLLGYMIL